MPSWVLLPPELEQRMLDLAPHDSSPVNSRMTPRAERDHQMQQ